MADARIGELPGVNVADARIGELPGVSEVQDETLFPAEQQEAARKITAVQLLGYVLTNISVEGGSGALANAEILTQDEYDRLPAGKKKSGLYVIVGEGAPAGGAASDIDLSGYAKLLNPVFIQNLIVGKNAAIGTDFTYETPKFTGSSNGSVIAGYGNRVDTNIRNSLCVGSNNFPSSDSSVMGTNCETGSLYSVALNYGTRANGVASISSGWETVAGYLEFVYGKWNVITKGNSLNAGNLFVLGNGSSDTARGNAFRVEKSGAAYSTGSVNSTGADYAEIYEWADNNPNAEDRVGRLVCLDGEKIRYATPEDDVLDILGIVSGNPSIVGDSHDDQWRDMYLRDVFGRLIYEDAEIEDPADPSKTIMDRRRKLNPAYDHTRQYTPQSKRPEKSAVGLLGKLVVTDDGTCEINGWCKSGKNGIAIKSEKRTRFRVMSRLDATHVRVNIMVQ